jgi:hypothetical protein
MWKSICDFKRLEQEKKNNFKVGVKLLWPLLEETRLEIIFKKLINNSGGKYKEKS